jgi:hypothetical protein
MQRVGLRKAREYLANDPWQSRPDHKAMSHSGVAADKLTQLKSKGPADHFDVM